MANRTVILLAKETNRFPRHVGSGSSFWHSARSRQSKPRRYDTTPTSAPALCRACRDERHHGPAIFKLPMLAIDESCS